MTLLERIKQFIRKDEIDDQRNYLYVENQGNSQFTDSSLQTNVSQNPISPIPNQQFAANNLQSNIATNQTPVSQPTFVPNQGAVTQPIPTQQYVVNSQPPNVASNQAAITQPIATGQYSAINWQPEIQNPKSELELPHWLENEDALRDEGVIFGLSDSKAEEKIAVIRTIFSHQSADLEKEVEQYNEKIGELNLFIEQKETRINELTEKARVLEEKEKQIHQLPRTLAGLLLSLAMCIGNYYLIEETLRSSYQQNHFFIAVGVFLAGMFNLFGRVSFFHDTDSEVSWRRALEEIGMPFAASFFVFVHAIESLSLVRSLALLFFVFFLFLFAGKLLLSNMTVTKDDLMKWIGNQQLNKDKNKKTESWDVEINQLKNEIDELRVKKWEIIPILNKTEAELIRVNGKRDSLIKLFESEFNLARGYKDRISEKDLKRIMG